MENKKISLGYIAENGVVWWPELQNDIKDLDRDLLSCIIIDAELSAKICRYKAKQIVFDIRKSENNLKKWGYKIPEDAIGPFVRKRFGIDLARLFKKIRRYSNAS